VPAERLRGTTGSASAERRRSAGGSAPADVDADPAAVARAIALRQLTAGPRTRAQLATAMRRRGVPEDVAQSVLDRFEDVSLVDDQEFARQWVTTRHAGRGLARRALSYELRQRGVADDLVRGAVDELTPADELAAARELVRRRAPSMRTDDPSRRSRRLAGMLARKGYSSSVALRAIQAELGDSDSEAYVTDDDTTDLD
jgi:regulatory protein